MELAEFEKVLSSLRSDYASLLHDVEHLARSAQQSRRRPRRGVISRNPGQGNNLDSLLNRLRAFESHINRIQAHIDKYKGERGMPSYFHIPGLSNCGVQVMGEVSL